MLISSHIKHYVLSLEYKLHVKTASLLIIL